MTKAVTKNEIEPEVAELISDSVSALERAMIHDGGVGRTIALTVLDNLKLVRDRLAVAGPYRRGKK